jgi:hypothetical protein
MREEAPSGAGPAAPRIERLDRYVLVVTPREPLVTWVRRVEANAAGSPGRAFTLDEAREYHRTAYLVPLAEDAHDVEAWVEENFDLVFEQELFGFEPDRRRWPRSRTLDTFLEWFDLELLDAPIDLVDAPLIAENAERCP